MITFGSDVADLILQRTLGENTLGLNNSINRMTTGYKVNQAKDNAAGYSIITDLSKKISSMLQVQQNTEDGIALLQTAEGGLEEVQKLLERLRDLATQASNGTYDAETREAMQAEADQILEQISQIRESIQYDNQNLYYRENNGNTTKQKATIQYPKIQQGGQLLFLLFPFQQTHYHLFLRVQRPLLAEKREQLQLMVFNTLLKIN